MAKVFSFKEAMKAISDASKIHLLLGNGFSIAIRPEIFTYGSLFANADFSAHPHIPKIFEALGTHDFEIAIKHVQSAAAILNAYDPGNTLCAQLLADAEFIKDALVSAVAKRHPSRPFEIDSPHYAACRQFLNHFDNIYTLNYDVILYWALMQSEVDDLKLRPDDGFRHPEGEDDAPYVSWQQANSARVHFLHGALHLFDHRTDIIKYTWSRTEIPIVEQVRQALNEDKFPLFVAEGTTESKRDRIMHNAYLHKALRSFEGCCGSPKSAVVIFGHSLADNDAHILRCISHGTIGKLLVGIYGNPESPSNKAIFAAASAIEGERKAKHSSRLPLQIIYYDTSSAKVWG